MNLFKYIFLGFLLVTSMQPLYAQSESGKNWQQDLDYLVQELEARHADLYHSISKEAFSDSVKKLETKLKNLNQDEFIVELARLTALIKDGHTGVFLPWAKGLNFQRLPLQFYHDSAGYFIIATSPEYNQLIGARLEKIGNTPVQEVANKIKTLLPRDNEYVLSSFAGTYMQLYELLITLSYIKNDSKGVPLTLIDREGHQQKVEISPVDQSDPTEWQYISDTAKLPLYLRYRNNQYWFEYIPKQNSVFLQFNSADIGSGKQEEAFAAFADSLVSFIEGNNVQKLIIDLRWNSGGSFTRTRYLLWGVIRSEKINQRGKLFTIIGPGTFSAATALATELDMHTKTLFVGDPTGGSPNAFGDLGRITLPNSGIEVWYSRWEMHQSLRSDHRPAIFPDLKAPITQKNYLNNHDPALEAIFSHQTRKPIAELIERIIENEGIKTAVKKYWELREKNFNSYDFSEHQLNTLGYVLLNDNRPDRALILFQINQKVFPYSPNSYDSLGDAYRALGKYDKAIKNYNEAFRIDKQYSHSRDKAQELLSEE